MSINILARKTLVLEYEGIDRKETFLLCNLPSGLLLPGVLALEGVEERLV